MTDLKRAKELLASDPALTCAFVKGERIDSSAERGVKPLLDRVDSAWEGGSAADKIVGRAAALLYALMRVKALYACVLSRSALETLGRFGISVEYGELTDRIVNRKGDGPCPMERATEGISDPQEGLTAIRRQLERLSEK